MKPIWFQFEHNMRSQNPNNMLTCNLSGQSMHFFTREFIGFLWESLWGIMYIKNFVYQTSWMHSTGICDMLWMLLQAVPYIRPRHLQCETACTEKQVRNTRIKINILGDSVKLFTLHSTGNHTLYQGWWS